MKSVVRRIVSKLIPKPLQYALFAASFDGMDEQQKHSVRVWHEMASMDWSLANIKRLGFNPHNIIDIGAYKGEWTVMVKGIFPQANVLMIEAQSSKIKFLDEVTKKHSGSVKYENCLLGPQAKEHVSFYEMETGSSVLRERSSIESVTTSRTMQTLDSVATKTMEGKIDFLKLDVQGYELEVLHGGSRVLQEADVVLMEVALLAINEGAPLLSEVVAFMKSHDFVAYDICSLMRRPLDDALCQTDFLFVKATSTLLQYQDYNE